jgi:hypothetical protein
MLSQFVVEQTVWLTAKARRGELETEGDMRPSVSLFARPSEG